MVRLREGKSRVSHAIFDAVHAYSHSRSRKVFLHTQVLSYAANQERDLISADVGHVAVCS